MLPPEPSPFGQRGPCSCSRPSRPRLVGCAASHSRIEPVPRLSPRGPRTFKRLGNQGRRGLGSENDRRKQARVSVWSRRRERRGNPGTHLRFAGEGGAGHVSLERASISRASESSVGLSRRRSSCCDHDRKNKTGRLNSVNSKTSWARQQSPASFPTSIKTVVCQSRAISVSLRSQSGRKWALRGIGWLPMCYGDFETHPTSLLVHETVQS